MVSMNFEREKRNEIIGFRVKDIRYDFGLDIDEKGIGAVNIYPIIDIEVQTYVPVEYVEIDYKIKFKD